jgi:hypothetical protein
MEPLMMVRLLPLLLPFVAACTAVRVQPVDRAVGMRHVFIHDNPRVTVANFVSVLRDRFEQHGVSTEVYSGPVPGRCEFILTCTARRSWDLATYLSHAELRIERPRGQTVASAEYHLRGKGGLSLMKWQSTRTEMEPVIDQLLDGGGRRE